MCCTVTGEIILTVGDDNLRCVAQLQVRLFVTVGDGNSTPNNPVPFLDLCKSIKHQEF